jgi:hypothetical protein
MTMRNTFTFGLLALVLASCGCSGGSPAPTSTESSSDTAPARLEPQELLVGKWLATVPDKSGGTYTQIMSFGEDGAFEVMLPPVKGKDVRIRGRFRFTDGGDLEMTVPPKADKVTVTARAKSREEMELQAPEKTLRLTRASEQQIHDVEERFQKEKARQASADNLQKIGDATQGSP